MFWHVSVCLFTGDTYRSADGGGVGTPSQGRYHSQGRYPPSKVGTPSHSRYPLAKVGSFLARISTLPGQDRYPLLARIGTPLARVGSPSSKVGNPLARVGTPIQTRYPLARVGTPRRQSSTGSTCYTAGVMPLALTQDGFLVSISNFPKFAIITPI